MRPTTRIRLIALLTLLSLLGSGMWQATHPTLDLLVVPGAQALELEQRLGHLLLARRIGAECYDVRTGVDLVG